MAGANGSGKTVFIRHLNGLLAPTKGKVFINGESIAKNITAARKKIGLVFQDADSQIVGQTAAEDVAFGPENLNLPRAEVERIVKESLQTVGLSEFSSQDPHKLSGGQKRKLALAGVLAMKPEVIMFDEPFSGLDYAGVLQVLAQLVQLHKEGHTIIVISHELEKVLAHADRLVIFHKGKLVEDGRPQEIISRAEQYGVRSPLKKDEDPGSLTWLR
ncbi:MAG: energy-coupling factor ABC transporter ATP-binding protein [Treponema sp.]|nr:energy-coupling factor ABC transporter ATP-binding protein [Treponema sp.]